MTVFSTLCDIDKSTWPHCVCGTQSIEVTFDLGCDLDVSNLPLWVVHTVPASLDLGVTMTRAPAHCQWAPPN